MEQLAGLDIEELMQIKVTLAARRPQPLAQSAAAVQVITNEDIRRSGAITLPETLRLVPGLDVAQINSSSWAISARGFNSNFANKMLVLVDGRSIYTPLFGGVFWDAQDTLLEDIDRIEVIRGPGASLWGANAVNGVIHIITRSAADTRGLRISGGGGTEERVFGSARQGGALGDHASYRIWGKYFLRDQLARPDGTGAGDDFHMLRGGLRLDWAPSNVDHLEVQGELFKNGWGERFTVPSLEPPFTRQVESRDASEGGHVRARWSRRLSDRSDWELQAYYDQIRRYIPEVASDERIDTLEVDFQHHTVWGERQELVWGASYRLYWDDTSEHFLVRFEEPRRKLNFFSAFVQDELALVVDRLRLTVGSKLEHTDTAGFELEPTLRLLWSPSAGQTVWAAFSRAVRTPARGEEDLIFTAGVVDLPPVAVIRVLGHRELKSQQLLAWEAGYRAHLAEALHLDLALFYNRYRRLRTLTPGEPDFSVSPAVIPLVLGETMKARTYGGELAILWQPLPPWHLQGAYTLFEMHLINAPEIALRSQFEGEGNTPRHQLQLRSSLDLAWSFELDGTVRFVSSLQVFDPPVPSYWEADVRLGWTWEHTLELSLVVRNLLHPRHREFGSGEIPPVGNELQRSVYGVLAWIP